MIKITSSNSKQFKYLLRVAKNKEDTFLLEGKRAIEQAISNGLDIVDIYLREDKDNPFEKGTFLTKELFQRLSTVEHSQGYLAVVKKKEGKIFSGSKVLLLDTVQDPGNLGTLLRSALAFGFHDVLLTKGCVDPYNPKVIRSSLSAFFKLNILTNVTLEFLEEIREKYVFIGSFLEKATSFREVEYTLPLVLVLGSESFGISKEVEKIIHKRVTIPMKESMESLNVAVAGSIMMEHIYSQDR